MRMVSFVPKDRTLTRGAWKLVDRIARASYRVSEREVAEAWTNAMIYGQGQYKIDPNDGRLERYLATGKL